MLSIGISINGKVYAQVSFIDSLKKIIGSKLSDTTKIDEINKIIFENANNYPEYTVEYSNFAIDLADTLKDSVRLSRSLNRKGISYYYLSDYNNALDQYFKSLEISEKLNNKEYIVSDYNNLGLVLNKENLYYEAITYFSKAIEIVKTINRPEILARVYDNVGLSYFSLDEYDTSLVYFRKSYELNKTLNQKKTMASNIKNIGNIFFERSDFKNALIHYKASLELNEKIDIKPEIALLLDKIGLVNALLGNFNEAEKNFNKAKVLIAEIKTASLHLQNLKSLSKYYELKGNFRASIFYYDKYIHLSDSIQNADNRKKFEQLKSLAKTRNEIKELQLLKDLSTAQTETIKKQRIIQYGAIALLLFSLVIIGLIYNTLRIKNRVNKKLEELVSKRTEELEMAKKKAEESDRNKSAFLVNLSHEVRTPMNAIIGFSDLLLNKSVDQTDKDEYIRNLQKGTLNFLKIFDNITYLAQLENKDISLIRKEFNLEKLFESVTQKVKQKIEETNSNISISFTLPGSLRSRNISNYLSILEKLLDELLDNAVKFTHDGEIRVWVNHENGEYHFFIKDTGEGIDSESLDRLYENFSKFSESRHNLSDGAGLGLSIVKKNLELIGGTIQITSKKGAGTQVHFAIPE